MSGYNGYTNYETWNVCLWLDNDQGTHEHWRERARDILTMTTTCPGPDIWTPWQAAVFNLETEIKNDIGNTCEAENRDLPGMLCDLLNSALQSVNWREVAETRFDDDWEGVEK